MNVIYKKDIITQPQTEGSILKILAYFSLFQYPLLRSEIIKYLPRDSSVDVFDDALEALIADGTVYRIAEFYSLQDDAMLVRKRRDANLEAGKLMPTAMRIGRFLSSFPFVRGVGISGSLSKMCADHKTDIDFFIITKANRLWIARTLMHLFKKLTFLTGKQHYYCMNYYLDEKALLLEDQNIYTAIETITLVPAGGEGLRDFFAANDWVSEWFGTYEASTHFAGEHKKRPWLKRVVEWMLDNKVGDKLDNYLVKLTTRRWQLKQQKRKRNSEGKEMALVTGKHFAKSNPGMLREKILTSYNKMLEELRRQYPQYF